MYMLNIPLLFYVPHEIPRYWVKKLHTLPPLELEIYHYLIRTLFTLQSYNTSCIGKVFELLLQKIKENHQVYTIQSSP